MDEFDELITSVKDATTSISEAAMQLRESKDRQLADMPSKETLMAWMAPEIKKALEEQAEAAELKDKGRPAYGNGEGSGPDGAAKPNPFKSFGDFCHRVITGKMPEDWAYMEGKAQTAGTTTAGGYLVPDQFVPKILEIPMEKAIVRPRAIPIPMETDSLKMPAFNQTTHATNFYGGALGYWVGETAAITESDAALLEVALSVNGLAALNYQSVRLLMASPLAVDALLTRIFGNVIAFMEDQAFIDGNGSAKPQGVIGSACEIAVSRNTGSHVKEIDAITMFADFMGSQDDGVWLANRTLIPDMMTWEDTEGTRIFQPNARDGLPATIFGIPVVWTEKCSAVGTKGDLILADFGYYLIGDLGQLLIDTSKERKFEYAQVGLRLLEFVDGKPWMASTYTPRKGTALSPFVVLN